jgi:glucan 1,3-beta-glucosidase
MGVNNFYLQLRNIIFDLRASSLQNLYGVHWPVGQATSIQNCQFLMQQGPQSTQQGVWIEDGSGGVMTDLYFQGGQYAMNLGNQQFTMRNITITGAQAAINQNWDWGWTYKSLTISNCTVGINMSTTNVGSVTLLDSNFNNVQTAILTGRNPMNKTGQGSLVIENVMFTDVPTVVGSTAGTPILSGFASGTVKDQGITIVISAVPFHCDSHFFDNLQGCQD